MKPATHKKKKVKKKDLKPVSLKRLIEISDEITAMKYKTYDDCLKVVMSRKNKLATCSDDTWEKYNAKFLLSVLDLFKMAREEVSEKDLEISEYKKVHDKYKSI